MLDVSKYIPLHIYIWIAWTVVETSWILLLPKYWLWRRKGFMNLTVRTNMGVQIIKRAILLSQQTTQKYLSEAHYILKNELFRAVLAMFPHYGIDLFGIESFVDSMGPILGSPLNVTSAMLISQHHQPWRLDSHRWLQFQKSRKQMSCKNRYFLVGFKMGNANWSPILDMKSAKMSTQVVRQILKSKNTTGWWFQPIWKMLVK